MKAVNWLKFFILIARNLHSATASFMKYDDLISPLQVYSSAMLKTEFIVQENYGSSSISKQNIFGIYCCLGEHNCYDR